MAEDPAAYSHSHVFASVAGQYLEPGEMIVAILHGERDNHFVNCPCHYAHIVYTSRHRLVCMSCGYMHAVLRHPLPLVPQNELSTDEWVEYFDDDGRLREEPVSLAVVDFRDVENADLIWSTDAWEEVKRTFVFFARSSSEEIQETIRGTEADPLLLSSAGFQYQETAPPPALQVHPASIEADLVSNAARSLDDGSRAYVAARSDPGQLLLAIPALFRCVELLLKARIEELGESAHDRRYVPAVLRRLVERGVNITDAESTTLDELRVYRNQLQHYSAVLNYQRGLSLCRRALIFLDCFAWRELSLWIGDAIAPETWWPILRIPEIAHTAAKVANDRAHAVVGSGGALAECQQCALLFVPLRADGARLPCLYCGILPSTAESPFEEEEGWPWSLPS